VDECASNHGGCDSLTTCSNVPGGYACGACPPGYDGNGASGCVAHTCSGAPDPSCACVHVAPGGDDALGAQTGGVTPFASVQAAIDFAAAHPEHATAVCIAEGSACGASATYPGPSGSDLTMRNGVSVYGDYESSGWTRCSSKGTTLLPQTSSGVVFDASVQSVTALDGLSVLRFPAPTTTGITITGARGAAVHGVAIGGGAGATSLFGIHVSGGAVATLNFVLDAFDEASGQPLRSVNNTGVFAVDSQVEVTGSGIGVVSNANGAGVGIWLANAAGSSVTGTSVDAEPWEPGVSLLGIHVESSSAAIALDDDVIVLNRSQNSAATTATGVELVGTGPASLGTTSISVGSAVTALGLRAKSATVSDAGPIVLRSLGLAPATSYGAWLEDAPGSVLTSAIAIAQAPVAEGIHVAGDTTGSVLTGSVAINVIGQAGLTLPAVYGATVTGISLSACAGTSATLRSPITVVRGLYEGTATGVSADADCPADIASSVTVQSASPRWSQTVWGISCGGACDVHDSNVAILGVDDPNPSLPPTVLPELDWFGVGCGALGRVTTSTVSGLSSATFHYARYSGTAVSAGNGTFVSGNRISGNCAGSGGAALRAYGSRVENNVIDGPTCGYALGEPESTTPDTTMLTSQAYGVYSFGADVNSNAVHGGGVCDFPPQFQTGTDPYYDSRPRACVGIGIAGDGTLRNNIVSGNVATTSTGVVEHNDLQAAAIWGPVSPFDARPALHTIAEFEQFDPSASGNFSLACFEGADSPCVDTGAKVGAPSVDFAGNPRDAYPDVGPSEWTGAPSACFGVDCDRGVCLSGACQCDPLYRAAHCDAPSECVTNHGGCDPLTTCTDTDDGHTCGACPPGYTGDGASGCVDIDECQTDDGGCIPPATCQNAPGTFSCVCPAGYSRVDEGCVSNDCATDNGGCDPLTTCTDTADGHTCGACPPGYTGDGASGCTRVCPCKHGGTCPSSGNDCICPPTFDGSDCDITFVALSAGQTHVCGLRSDHFVRCWGWDMFGETDAPDYRFSAVSVGLYHSCGIVEPTGSIQCWGQDSTGQTEPPLGQFKAIASGAFDNCAIATDGSIACWGRDSSGSAPTPPSSGTFTQISGTSGSFCAVDSDQLVACFGQPDLGSPPADQVLAVSTGNTGSCRILLDGTLDCWGNGNIGSIPSGSFTSVSVGTSGICALPDDGHPVCFADNGALAAVPDGAFKTVTVGEAFACGIRSDDSVVCWGTDQGLGALTPPY
jgi:hypothetical protein